MSPAKKVYLFAAVPFCLLETGVFSFFHRYSFHEYPLLALGLSDLVFLFIQCGSYLIAVSIFSLLSRKVKTIWLYFLSFLNLFFLPVLAAGGFLSSAWVAVLFMKPPSTDGGGGTSFPFFFFGGVALIAVNFIFGLVILFYFYILGRKKYSLKVDFLDKKFLAAVILFNVLFIPKILIAADIDTDGDGLVDEAELSIYYTFFDKSDSDGDGYSDQQEINHGYSPHRAEYRLNQLDWDKDGLNDDLELKFGTNLKNSDSDGDGYSDGAEVNNGYNPLSSDQQKLSKKIEIYLASQELDYFLGGVALGSFPVSAGVASRPTPVGEFKIYNKVPKAWSSLAGLWMPYWMAFTSLGQYGLHELPIWPNGYREGSDHLGTPASHGCVRLGIGPAEFLYHWADIGTPVIIQ